MLDGDGDGKITLGDIKIDRLDDSIAKIIVPLVEGL